MNWFKRAAEEREENFGQKEICEGGVCHRIDREKISPFRNNPYILYPSGSSAVGSPEDKGRSLGKGERYMEGLYAGDLSLIAPYALSREVPWLLVVPHRGERNPLGLDTGRPTLFVNRRFVEGDHPPVWLSTFRRSDFRPRREVTREYFGAESSDEGDDEWISVSPVAPRPLEQREVRDPIALIREHVNIREVGDDPMELARIAESVERANREGPLYSAILTDGRGRTEVIEGIV